MKQTFYYPQTLRNYDNDDENLMRNSSVSNNNKLAKSKSTCALTSNRQTRSRKIHEEDHEMNEYGVLTNKKLQKIEQQIEKKANGGKKEQKGKTKGKTKSQNKKNKESLLSVALKNQLSSKHNKKLTSSLNSSHQIGTQNYIHCQSLQKLQIISNDRSQQIRQLIQQKAQIQAQNAELKLKLSNPTLKEGQLINKVAQQQQLISDLRKAIQRLENSLNYIEGEHQKDIQELKRKHEQEIARVKREVEERGENRLQEERVRFQKIIKRHQSAKGSSGERQINNSGSRQKLPPPRVTYSSQNNSNQSQFEVSKVKNYLNIDQNQESVRNNISVNNLNRYPLNEKYHEGSNDQKGNTYRTYIGEDGFERRVINSNNSNNQIQEGKKIETTITPSFTNEAISKNLSSNYSPVSSVNAGVTSNGTALYRYGSGGGNMQTYTNERVVTAAGVTDGGLSNNNISSGGYSNSLTFQCFNDATLGSKM